MLSGIRDRLRRRDVDHDGAGEFVAAAEVGEVGGERRDEFLVRTGVAGQRPTGAYLRVCGREFGSYRRGQPVRQHSPGRQCLGPFGQRTADGVVSAEDQGVQRRQPAVGEGRGLGDHARRRVEPRRDGCAARRGGGGDGAACSDEPDSGTNGMC